ncbi:Rrp15p-domain-containing protein [Emericellopsis cladophorae]|uniref:Rrp15p-domain-containing protein n=1 Tax=Emericellopsis cladophorae TaxID=2686198 RepID=A0A9P9Y2P8_9HYPO|nr:Rrp15p-domain-containing protein [Emericellopsis cladophorae]KAI6782411.1 Rrp15p-domain-containing protein [Emericellopsis cladophorae]
MAGPKRSRKYEKPKLDRPSKKQKRQLAQYNSDSEEEQDDNFDPVNLLDSDDDIHNAEVDDGAPSAGELSSGEEEEETLKKPAPKKKMSLKSQQKAPQPAPESASENEDDSESEGQGEDDDFDDDDDEDEDEDDDDQNPRQSKKKRDNSAFATSLTKILGTKLATSKRADPVLSRSAEAHSASRAILDNALEAKARKQLRDQKRRAFEKGRVKDVLVASRNEKTGEMEATTAEIMETERRLRKVAQRGVVKLFNAVRAAQVAATEAEKGTRKAGVIGMDQREGKVNELSKKGFLDLIASGGGGLKKTAIEEA